MPDTPKDNIRHAELTIFDEKMGELLNILGFILAFNQLNRNGRVLVGLISVLVFFRMMVYAKMNWLQAKKKNIPVIMDIGVEGEYLDSMGASSNGFCHRDGNRRTVIDLSKSLML